MKSKSWERRRQVLKALASSGVGAITFFSWLGIHPTTVAHWGAAIASGVIVLLLGAVFFLGIDDQQGLTQRIGIGAVFAMTLVVTLAAATATAWLVVAKVHIGPKAERPSINATSALPARALIEGNIGVANQETGDDYRPQATAKVGETIAAQAWYYNTENVDSGIKALALLVRFEPSRASGPQDLLVTIAGSNTNQVVDSARIVIPDNARLQYVPSSATWRHNRTASDQTPEYVTEGIPDRVVEGGVILEDAGPCLNCEATVRVLFYVVAF